MAKKAKLEVKAAAEHETKSLRQLAVDGLKQQLLVFSKDQFKLRMQKASGAAIKPHLIKQVRRSIAKIKTILSEKNNSQVTGV